MEWRCSKPRRRRIHAGPSQSSLGSCWWVGGLGQPMLLPPPHPVLHRTQVALWYGKKIILLGRIVLAMLQRRVHVQPTTGLKKVRVTAQPSPLMLEWALRGLLTRPLGLLWFLQGGSGTAGPGWSPLRYIRVKTNVGRHRLFRWIDRSFLEHIQMSCRLFWRVRAFTVRARALRARRLYIRRWTTLMCHIHAATHAYNRIFKVISTSFHCDNDARKYQTTTNVGSNVISRSSLTNQ